MPHHDETVAAPTVDTESHHHPAYHALLINAVRALTDAARVSLPRRISTEEGGRDKHRDAAPERVDWAEFVTAALAGAAANLGGIDAALEGRPGSWEADGVRQLLVGVVGHDKTYLWAHRTDPIEINLYVDEILLERTTAHTMYEQAQAELDQQYQAAQDAWDPAIDARHLWTYHRTDSGEMVATDPDAPAWSWDTWRTGLATDTPETLILGREDMLRTGEPRQGAADDRALTASVPKTPTDADVYFRILDEHDAELDAIGDLDEQLEAQRLREWADYGNALGVRIRTLVAALPGLSVPVQVHTDVHTVRAHQADPDAGWSSLETRLIETAISSTPTPADLLGGPLDRLAAGQADDVSSDKT